MVRGRKNTGERGDIVLLDFSPTEGGEIHSTRPAIILSKSDFNAIGLSLVAPITGGGAHARFAGWAVSLAGTGTTTTGVILLNQIRMMDIVARRAKFVEKAPDYVVDDALARLATLLD